MIRVLQKISNFFSGSPQRTQAKFLDVFSDNYRRILAKYDAADSKDRHWSRADHLSANASASPEVRKLLRERSRYEIKNNSYGQGIVDTIANDTVGPGIKLQFMHVNPKVNKHIESLWEKWNEETGFAEKCLLLRTAKIVDGESFAIFGTNNALEHPVKLDLALLESEQISSPLPTLDQEENYIDGIRINEFGSAISYDVLKYHPGDLFFNTTKAVGEHATIPAQDVIHYYKPKRARQARGIPETTPALPLFGQMRRVTLAVTRAFEIAADVAGIIRTANLNIETETLKSYDQIPMYPGMWTVLPEGWNIEQFKSSQPVTTYKMWKDEILCEIIRCMSVPFNVGAGRSDGYNYASGRMDFQTYMRSTAVERKIGLEYRVLNRTFNRWRREMVLVAPKLKQSGVEQTPYGWLFDSGQHVDPLKETQASIARVDAGLSSRAIEIGARGYDVDDVFDQLEREAKIMREKGILQTESKPYGSDEPDDLGDDSEPTE